MLTRIQSHILALMMIGVMTMPAWGVGTVNQSLAQIPGSTNYVFTENWTADATTGSVPATVMAGTGPLQGFRIVSVEIAPGSPAPTNNYTVTITDFSGADVLGGAGANQSSTTAGILPSLANTPPLYGAFTVNVTGNVVNSAQGRILVYFAPVSQVIGNTPTGSSLTATNLFTGANTFSGTTSLSGPVVATGTDSGNQTITGNKTFQGNNSFSGTSTLTGTATMSAAVSAPSLNGSCVISAAGTNSGNSWTTIQGAITGGTCGLISDEGSANLAMGALAITRSVYIRLGAGTYTTTGMNMSACSIITGMAQNTFISVSGNTSTGLSLSYTTTNNPGCGLRDVRLSGPGNGTTSVGINMNSSGGSQDHFALIQNVQVASFGTGTTWTNVSGFNRFISVDWFSNGQNIVIPSGGGGENNAFIGCSTRNPATFAAGGLSNAANFDVNLTDLSYDNAQIFTSNGHVKLEGGHGECNPFVNCTGVPMILQQGGTTVVEVFHHGIFLNAGAAQNQVWWQINGGTGILSGGFWNSAGTGATAAINTNGGFLNMETSPVITGWTTLFTPTGALNANLAGTMEYVNAALQYTTYTGSAGDVTSAAGQGTFLFNSAQNCYRQSLAGGTPTCMEQVNFTNQKAETGSADTNVLTVTPISVAGNYRACFVTSVSSATAGVIAWTLSWTDSNGNAQSNIAQDLFQDGTAAPATTFTTSAAGNYHFCREFDINNAGASIIVKWVGGGTTAAKVTATVERII